MTEPTKALIGVCYMVPSTSSYGSSETSTYPGVGIFLKVFAGLIAQHQANVVDSLSYGTRSVTRRWLLQDSIHLSELLGRRVRLAQLREPCIDYWMCEDMYLVRHRVKSIWGCLDRAMSCGEYYNDGEGDGGRNIRGDLAVIAPCHECETRSDALLVRA